MRSIIVDNHGVGRNGEHDHVALMIEEELLACPIILSPVGTLRRSDRELT